MHPMPAMIAPFTDAVKAAALAGDQDAVTIIREYQTWRRSRAETARKRCERAFAKWRKKTK